MAVAVVRMEYFIGVLVVVGCFGCTHQEPASQGSDREQ
jgi:hypothetical protein